MLMFSMAGVCLVIAMLGDAGSCRQNQGAAMKPSAGRNEKLSNGVWGGQHVRAEVIDSGASIEFDCAHGTIDEPIVLDRKGSFDVKGKFTTERGGPTRGDENSQDRVVRYRGQVKEQELSLTIMDAGTKETIDTFALTHGSDGRIRKCR